MGAIVQSFIDLYGREPSPYEIGRLMEIEARIAKKRNKLMSPNKYNPEMKSAAMPEPIVNKKKKQKLTRLSYQGKQINRLLKMGITLDKISYILDEPMSLIEYQINKHNMPREDVK